MSKQEVWEEYIAALEKQNRAKDQERTTLYDNLQKMQQENDGLRSQLHTISMQMSQKDVYIEQLSSQLQQLINNCDSMHIQILNKQQLLSSYNYEKQDYMQANRELEEIVVEQINCLKEKDNQMNILKEQNKSLQAEILEVNSRKQNEEEIRVLIENYEKIEKLASEFQEENVILIEKNKRLQAKLEKLQNKIRSTVTTDLQESQSFGIIKEIPSKIELIHQNNQLIEKIIEVERQKNEYYLILRDNDLLGEPGTALKQVYPENIDRECSLAEQIERLKQENEVLLENLRI